MKKSLIYTKTGDKGKTALVGGTRVSKTHIRLESYGTVDELNSFIGWLICSMEEDDKKQFLSFIQHKLFVIGSYLATETDRKSSKDVLIITDDNIISIEKEIDELDSVLPKLNRFILPGGTESASRAHICRTICRRAERIIYKVAEIYPIDDNIMVFINRLSDYFFVLARYESNKQGKEIYWIQ